jgi:Peptidase M15
MIRAALTTGLETTRTNYNRGGIRLTSGYRCPHGNANVGGVVNSLHVHGRAADMYSADHTWTETEFNLLKAAADATGPIESFTWTEYDDHHYHAAW